MEDLFSKGWDESFDSLPNTFQEEEKKEDTSRIMESDDEDDENEVKEEEEGEEAPFELEEISFVRKQIINNEGAIRFIKVFSENIYIVTEDNYIYYYDSEKKSCKEFVIEEKKDEVVHNIFLDPSEGYHLLISMTNGDNYYLNTNLESPIEIKDLKNTIIESAVFDTAYEISDEATGGILLGTSDSCIYYCIIELEHMPNPIQKVKMVFDFRTRDSILVATGPITGIELQIFPEEEFKPPCYIVMASTSNRLFEFIGGPNLDQVFLEYQKNVKLLTYTETPTNRNISIGIKTNSELHFQSPPEDGDDDNMDEEIQTFCWLSNSGIVHGNLHLLPGYDQPGSNPIEEFEILQYESNEDTCLSIGMSEYHILMLYKDKIVALMQPVGLCSQPSSQISNSKNKVEFTSNSIPSISISQIKKVYSEKIPFGTGKKVVKDMTNGELYIYSDQSLYKVNVLNEENDVWRLYLERALDPLTSKKEYFDIANTLCQEKPKDKDMVMISKADYSFNMGEYMEAADLYSKTSKPFEDVTLQFHKKGKRDALRRYLLNMLKVMKQLEQSSQKTQKTVLIVFIVELYLDKINQLYDEFEGKNPEMEKMEEEFKNFLELNVENTNNSDSKGVIELIFKLISSHGHTNLLITFAKKTKNYERVISHYLTQSEPKMALSILDQYCKESKFDTLFYKYSPRIMEHLPDELVEVLMKKRFLNPARLIPSLMRYLELHDPDKDNLNNDPVIKYLKWAIESRRNEQQAIHNLLLSLYAKYGSNDELLDFIQTDGEYFFDPKFGLRICEEKKRKIACVYLLSLMELYDDALELALTIEVDLAKKCAEGSPDDEQKKKLWLKIVKHVINQENNVKKAINFLKETDIIKLEDILPYFPDSVVIDDFKNEICSSLKKYKIQIEELNSEMNEAQTNANLIRDDIKELKGRYRHISSNRKCDHLGCFQNVLARDFFLFPCGHSFHVDCLSKLVIQNVSKKTKGRVEELMKKRRQLLSDQMINLENSFFGKKKSPYNELKELDNLIASECPYCSELIINTVDSIFINPFEEEKEVDEWSIPTQILE